MLTLEQAFAILARLVRRGTAAYHQDYDRVCGLADLYYKLITDDKSGDLLQQFILREDEDAFTQRKNITQLLNKSWAGCIMQPFYRPGRLDNIKRVVGYKTQDAGADVRAAELEGYIRTYWGSESLENYIAQRMPSLSFLDPNAFLVTEFANFDARYTKAKPYPVEVSCKKAVDFRYTNNTLDYLIVREPSQYIDDKGILHDGATYLMYLANDIIKLTEFAPTSNSLPSIVDVTSVEIPVTGIFHKDQATHYRLDLYQPNGGKVQAKRIGYIFDPQTEGRTFVNPLDNAVPYFMKAVKSVSELDLTHALHAFPQKFFYTQACPGERVKMPTVVGRAQQTVFAPCSAGINTKTGHTCQRCKGSGVLVHKSAQDAQPVKMPKPGEQVNVKLDDMVAYKAPPVELLKVLHDYVKSLEVDAIKAVYNSEVLQRTAGQPDTATARVIDKDEMYNTLAPFAEQCASIWRYHVELIAEFTDNASELYLVYEYPSDFKLKTLGELYADRKAAVDAGLPYHLIQAIDRDIAAKMFVDNEVELLKFKVKQRYAPFGGKAFDELALILSTGRARKLDEVLYTHGDTIFDELETEVPDFFYMTPVKQWEYIKPKVDLIISELPVANELGIQLEGGTSAEGLPAPAADAKEKLRTSVGAAGIVRQVRLDISEGLSTRADGINQLIVQLGYTEQEASLLIGSASAIQKNTQQLTQ
jgi:hypothetical protein